LMVAGFLVVFVLDRMAGGGVTKVPKV